MRTFVVLYILKGLGRAALRLLDGARRGGRRATSLAAALATRFGDHWGLGNVILGASVVYGLGLLGAGLRDDMALVVLRRHLPGRNGGRDGHDLGLGPPLQGDSADGPRDDHRASRRRRRGSASSSARSPPAPRSTSCGPTSRRPDGYAARLARHGHPRACRDPLRDQAGGGRSDAHRQGDASGSVSPKPQTLSRKT